MRKHLDAHVSHESIKPLPEFLEPGASIETVSAEFGATIATEAFMNELLTIVVHTTTDRNANPVPVPCVGEGRQPIVRGVHTPVKRKYVEALARAKEEHYEQRVNPNSPDQSDMVAYAALSYPFTVIADPNPLGRAWLEAILAQPA